MCILKKCNLGLVSAVLLLAVVACRGETTPLEPPPTSSPSPIRTATPTLEATPSPTDAIETLAGPTPSPEAPCFGR